MFEQNQINTILKYILFFCLVYISTCFFDKSLIYYWLFIIFFIALIAKITFYSNASTLINICYLYLGICVLGLFADMIKDEAYVNTPMFKSIITIMAIIGQTIKTIFTKSLVMYMFVFMITATVYASLVSEGNANMAILGWIMGILTGLFVWLFLS